MDIPSLFMIPSAVSSGKVHSVFPNSTDADFDFNRDSDATRVNSEGLIERVGYYGSESVINGTFDTDTNWNKTQAVIQNGQAIITSPDGSYAAIEQSSILTTSQTYYYSIEVISISGTMQLRAGSGTDIDITTSGVHRGYIVANSTGLELKRKSGAGALSVIIDNVSLKQVNGDRARLNYEIEGGLVNTKPSLLLEPQSTNLYVNSEPTANEGAASGVSYVDFNWSLGFTNATEFTSGDFRYGGSVSASTVNSLSFFIIMDDLSQPVVGANSGAGDFSVVIGGSLMTSGFEVKNFGNNVYRVCVTGTSGTNTSNNGIVKYNSQSSKSFKVVGWQLEQQSYATSYIPTNGSAQTRAGETCLGAGTSSIFEDTDGILYCEIANIANNVTHSLALSDGSSANVVFIGYNPLGRLDANVRRSSAFQAIFNYTGVSDSTVFNKIAFRFQANNFQLWVNGSEVATDTSGIVPFGLQELAFDDGSGSNPFYGKIRDIRVYNTKEMTDSEVDILLTKITS